MSFDAPRPFLPPPGPLPPRPRPKRPPVSSGDPYRTSASPTREELEETIVRCARRIEELHERLDAVREAVGEAWYAGLGRDEHAEAVKRKCAALEVLVHRESVGQGPRGGE